MRPTKKLSYTCITVSTWILLVFLLFTASTTIAQNRPTLPQECIIFVEPAGPGTTANGTGTFISTDGYVLTNFHVVNNFLAPGWQGTVSFGIGPNSTGMGFDSVVTEFELISTDEGADLALLKLALPNGVRIAPHQPDPENAGLTTDFTARIAEGTNLIARGFQSTDVTDPNTGIQVIEAPIQVTSATRMEAMSATAATRSTPPATYIVPPFLALPTTPLEVRVGYSGGPWLTATDQRYLVGLTAFGYTVNQTNFPGAIPLAYINGVFGLGDKEFRGPKGYQLPAELQPLVAQGRDPFLARKLAFYERIAVSDPIAFAEILGATYKLGQTQPQALETFRSLLERPGLTGDFAVAQQSARQYLLTEGSEIFIKMSVDDYLRSSLKGGNSETVAYNIEYFLTTGAAYIIIRHAAELRQVILQLPDIGAPITHHNIALLLARFGGHTPENLMVQFGTNDPISAHRAYFDTAGVDYVGPRPLDTQGLRTVMKTLLSFNLVDDLRRTGTDKEGQPTLSRALADQLETMLALLLVTEEAGPILAEILAKQPIQPFEAQTIPGIPPELVGQLRSEAEGRDLRLPAVAARQRLIMATQILGIDQSVNATQITTAIGLAQQHLAYSNRQLAVTFGNPRLAEAARNFKGIN